MKYLASILLLLFITTIGLELKAQSETELVEICQGMLDGATYLKDFPAKLEANPPQPQRYSLVLSKGTQYKFSICSSADYPGQGILQVFDTNRMLVTTYMVATGKHYPAVNFDCHKTGVYHILIKFQDDKPGLAVGMLSFVKKL